MILLPHIARALLPLPSLQEALSRRHCQVPCPHPLLHGDLLPFVLLSFLPRPLAGADLLRRPLIRTTRPHWPISRHLPTCMVHPQHEQWPASPCAPPALPDLPPGQPHSESPSLRFPLSHPSASVPPTISSVPTHLFDSSPQTPCQRVDLDQLLRLVAQLSSEEFRSVMSNIMPNTSTTPTTPADTQPSHTPESLVPAPATALAPDLSLYGMGNT